MSRFWHGFADMHTVARTRGRDPRPATASGSTDVERPALPRRDRRPLVLQRRLRPARDRRRRRRAAAPGCRPTRRSAPTRPSRRVELADRLAALAPIADAVVFLGSGGSDAVDTAAKLARRYWDVVGKPEKRIIVSREHGYHGMHALGHVARRHRPR